MCLLSVLSSEADLKGNVGGVGSKFTVSQNGNDVDVTKIFSSIYFQQFSSLLYSPKAMRKSMIKRKSERRKSIEHRGRYVPDCQPTDQVYLQTKRREIQHGHDRDTLVLIFASAFVNSICVDEEPLACIIDWLQIAIVVGGYHCCHAAFLLIVGFIAHPKCISIMILPLDAFALITIREWRK